MNYSYEKEQIRLQKLWQEMLSDEEEDPFVGSPDEYIPSGDDNSSDESDYTQQHQKRHRTVPRQIQEPAINIISTDTGNIASTSAEGNDLELQTIEEVIHNYTADDDVDGSPTTITNLDWHQVTGLDLKKFPFTNPNSGISPLIYETYYNKEPIHFYELFLNDEILNMMVLETNRYAAQCKEKESAPKARIHRWHDIDTQEMKRFFGVLFWMGLCQYPSVESYWSKELIYYNKIRHVMSRNRFQLILKVWHFHDNEVVTNNRLQKILPLVEKLIENFRGPIIPKESLCIDETLVPFRGRLKFRQYIKNKRHKFGIKLYKLCLEKGYTFNLQIYCGEDKIEGQSSSQNVVLMLAKNLLNEGRTIYTDNYYTSVALAHELLHNKTHLVGTLRSNRKLNPKEVTPKKLRKGETVSVESNSGVVVQKWMDKREVLTLSTKHTSEMVKVKYGDKETEKPAAVIDYNKHKSYIDVSDQMKAYNTCLRRGVKWYRKLAIELLTGTAFVNAYILHQQVTNVKMSITRFQEIITKALVQLDTLEEGNHEDEQHVLVDVGRTGRSRCILCYEKLVQQQGRSHAQARTPKTKLRCCQCSKNYCLPCFFAAHHCTK